MNFSGNQKGFSLVEVMLVLAISSILGVVVMQTMRDSANAMAFSEAKFEEQELARQIQSNLIYKPGCEVNLGTKVLGPVNATELEKVFDFAGNDLFEKGQTVGNSIKITGFEFNIKPEAIAGYNAIRAAWPADQTYYMLDAEFKIKTQKLKTTLGAKEVVRTIPVRVKIDASSTVRECFSTSDAADYTAMSNFCQQMGGTLDANLNRCVFAQSCAATTPEQMIPAKCVDEKVNALVAEIGKLSSALAALENTRAPAAVVAATPAATPTTIDPYTLPFSRTNPGPGCKGMGCAASDFGPCEGVSCTTNGGQCTGVACRTGVVTGTVVYDGTNMYTPANPGPGCSGMGCHASDYGPCAGVSCTTNGGSCNGTSCRTGITR